MGELVEFGRSDDGPERAKKLGPHRDELKALKYATAVEKGELDPLVGYSARVWAQVSLPYSDPGDIPFWERRNGAVSLTMRPALLRDKETGERKHGYPFGLVPRHALTWIATEAVRTRSRELHLGSSMRQFLEKIGVSSGGKDHQRVTSQLRRLFGSQMNVEGLAVTEDGHGEVDRFIQIADEVRLWFTKNDELDEQNIGLWRSGVTLSEQFYASLLAAPVPVNIDAMKALGSSPMRLDIYLWATYRVFMLDRPVRILWTDLADQFGSNYKHPRQFKAAFIENLKIVRIVYPDLDVEPADDYLILRPSKPHVTPTKRRNELI